MPRKPRFYLPLFPAHIIQRGNDRQAVFFTDDDYTAYLIWLNEGAQKYSWIGVDLPRAYRYTGTCGLRIGHSNSFAWPV